MLQSLTLTNNFSNTLLLFCEPEGEVFELKTNQKATIIIEAPFAPDELELVYAFRESQPALTIWTKRATYRLVINEVLVF